MQNFNTDTMRNCDSKMNLNIFILCIHNINRGTLHCLKIAKNKILDTFSFNNTIYKINAIQYLAIC